MQLLKAATYPVTSNADNGAGTLRAAINSANANAGADNIEFNFTSATTITLSSILPIITGPVFINGYSAPSSAVGPIGSRTIRITVNGGNTSSTANSGGRTFVDGLFRFAAGSTGSEICGLSIINTADDVDAIMVEPSVSNKHIWGNYIGVNAAGVAAAGTANRDDAVFLGDPQRTTSGSSSNIYIGTDGDGVDDANEGNVLSNNSTTYGGDGVQVGSPGFRFTITNLRISGNYIGLAADGTTIAVNGSLTGTLGGGTNGLYFLNITGAGSDQIIIGTNANGTSDALEGNVISGNAGTGIGLNSCNNIHIAGNLIGTDKTGLLSKPNGAKTDLTYNAVRMATSGDLDNQPCYNIYVGFNDAKAGHIASRAAIVRNVISGNANRGIGILGVPDGGLQHHDIKIAGNYIGVTINGNTILANGQDATATTFSGTNVFVTNATNVIVGTNGNGDDDDLEGNVISAAKFGNGVYMASSGLPMTNSRISGNKIGVGADGTTPMGNDYAGVAIDIATDIVVGSNDNGTSDALEANIIANNATIATSSDGVRVTGASTGVRISRNSFYNNRTLPIDLANDGISLNDGAATTGLPNLLLDYPVITGYSLIGTTMTVSGYVSICNGTENNAGASIAGAKTIQFYKVADDGDQDGAVTGGTCTRTTNHGEGVQYLGSISSVTNAFSTSFSLIAGATFTSSDKITAIAIDAAGNTSEFGVTTNIVDISGKVINDANNSATIQDGSETGTSAGTNLYVYLITGGVIIDSAKVATDGSYTLQGATSTTYTLEFSTQQYVIGTTGVVAATIVNTAPGGWVTTGEGANNTDDGNVDGVVSLTTGTGNTSNANFGIQQPPTAVNDAGTGTLGNPVNINVVANDTDPSPGTIDPARVSLITPGGATGVTTDAQGDVTGFTVTGQGTWAVNTTTGAVTFTPQAGYTGNPTPVNYTVRDNGGAISNEATVTITYPIVSISGKVVNDVNNSSTILDGSEIGINAGTNLYVYLVSPTGVIVDSAKVATDGTYTLQGSPSTAYTLELSTQEYIIGTTGVVAALINNILPSGWVLTGEGANNTDDITVDGVISLTTGTGSTSNSNFGILEVCDGDRLFALSTSTTSGSGGIFSFINPPASGSFGIPLNPSLIAPAIAANALAYNPVNKKFYFFQNSAVNPTPNTFRSYDPSTGIYSTLATPSASAIENRGGIKPDGTGYYKVDASGRMAYYNIAANSWTTISNQWVDQSGTNITSNILAEASGDLAFDANGNMWMLTSPSGVGNQLNVYKVSAPLPTTAQSSINVTLVASHSGFTGTAMGIAFSNTGDIYIGTTAQRLFKLENDLTLTDLGVFHGSSSVFQDLTSCAFPLDPLTTFDFGDAPNSYGTLRASDGPRHSLSFYNPVANTSKLMLGSLLDNEIEGAPNAAANGDDINEVDDEDGITVFPSLTTGATTYSVTVNVTNTTGNPNDASISGWIDFNKNGVFDASEKASAAVPNNAITVTLTWAGLSGLTAGNTYARFRIASQALEIANPTGLASDGEVEDYSLPIRLIVSGTVYQDANGLQGTPANTVDGTGTNAGVTLYAILYENTTGAVIDIAEVPSNGIYSLGAVAGNNASIYLSTTSASIGQTTLPTVTPPTNWVNVGEVGNAVTGIGSDHLTNGTNGLLDLGTVSNALNEANFGIEQRPETENVTLLVTADPAGGRIELTMPLNGSDPEDGPTDGSLSTDYNFVITSLPANAKLYYNNIEITAADVAAGTGTARIDGYDPAGLSFEYTVTPTLTTEVVFTYASVDNAGMADLTPATYTITISTLLPAQGFVLAGARSGNTVSLNWSTLSEQNTSHFVVEKSTDGINYLSISGNIKAAGNSLTNRSYGFTDNKALGVQLYYRIKLVDNDGKERNSNVVLFKSNSSTTTIKVFPNPAQNFFYVNIDASGKYQVQVIDGQGKIVSTQLAQINSNNLLLKVPCANFASGLYQVKVTDAMGNINTIPVVIIK